jgi:hypothetical protein
VSSNFSTATRERKRERERVRERERERERERRQREREERTGLCRDSRDQRSSLYYPTETGVQHF